MTHPLYLSSPTGCIATTLSPRQTVPVHEPRHCRGVAAQQKARRKRLGGASVGQVVGGGGAGPATSAKHGEVGWVVHSAALPTPAIEMVERKKR